MSESVSELSPVSCEPACRKFVALRQIVALYSHEITNQLTIIIGRSEQALGAADHNSALQANLDEISEAARRIAILSRKLLAVPDA